MRPSFRTVAAALALGISVLATPASATIIDFNDPALTNLYFRGDSFEQNGYRMTVDYDFGTVDRAAALPVTILGNTTPFYFQSNDGGLILEHARGEAFDLRGFRAAFVPVNASTPFDTFLVAIGKTMGGTTVAQGFALPGAVNGSYRFGTYNAPSVLSNLAWVEFFACSNAGCSAPTMNAGQFALDDIQVVPEPTSIALAIGALAGLAAARRARKG